MKKIASIFLVILMLLPSLAFPLDQVGDPKAIPGFETETQVDTTRSVTTITVQGTALGLYPDEQGRPKYAYGVFGMQGSGFIVNNYIITAAHVVNPTSLVVRMPDGAQFDGPLVHVKDMTIVAGGSPARIFYINVAEDYAILIFDTPCQWFRNLTIKTMDTWANLLTIFGFYPINKLHSGDQVFAIVRVRDENGARTTMSEVRTGVIRAEKPVVPLGYEDSLPWFSMDDFTTDLVLYPGDSGSPIIGFEDGVPYLIGIGRAAGTDPKTGDVYSWCSRIDMVKLITDSVF